MTALLNQRRKYLQAIKELMDIYERFGRKQEKLEQIAEAYDMTLDLLRALKSNEASLERVEVGDKGWTYKGRDA